MKVLFVNDTDRGGGSARAAYGLCVEMRRFGVRTRMFVQNKKTNDDGVFSISDVAYKLFVWGFVEYVALKIKNRLQRLRWKPYKKTQDGNYKTDLRGRYIFNVFKNEDYDVLHLHWINNRFIKISDLPRNKPIVWTLHDSWPFCGVCHYFFDCKKYKEKCGYCPELGSGDDNDLSRKCWETKAKIYNKLNLHIVAPSRWLAECARQSSLFSNVDVRVIPNSVDTDIFKPIGNTVVALARKNIKEKRLGKPIILYGAVNAATDKRKGFASLLSALQVLHERGADDFSLLVFGANDGDVDMPVEIDVMYVGYVSDPKEMALLYNRADVTVVPSLTENLSCVIMESLACGTPVAAFDIGGNSDMVDHKRNGYLAHKDDNEDLANAITWCLENNDSMELSVNALKKIQNNFTPEIVGKRYAELYAAVSCKI